MDGTHHIYMRDEKYTHKNFIEKSERPRNRGDDTLKMDLKELCQEHVDWTDVTQN